MINLFHNEQVYNQDIKIIYAVNNDMFTNIWEHDFCRKSKMYSINLIKISTEDIKVKYNYFGHIYPVFFIYKKDKLIQKKYGYLKIEQLINDFSQK